jgi:hypothetical protein
MLQLRSPLELRRRHPDEANELEIISRALDSAGVTYPDPLSPPNDGRYQSLEEVAQAHRRLAEKYDGILARIRNLPVSTSSYNPRSPHPHAVLRFLVRWLL